MSIFRWSQHAGNGYTGPDMQLSDAAEVSSTPAENRPCSALTRKGLPCKKRAAAGSNPPACAWHAAAGKPPGDNTAAQSSAYVQQASRPAARQSDSEQTRSLAAEIALVRSVLERLMDRLATTEGELPMDDLRALAMLIFSGARTVAQLLTRHTADTINAQNWVYDALDKLSASVDLEL